MMATVDSFRSRFTQADPMPIAQAQAPLFLLAKRNRRRAESGAVTVRDGKIVELDFLADPERLAQLDLTVLDG